MVPVRPITIGLTTIPDRLAYLHRIISNMSVELYAVSPAPAKKLTRTSKVTHRKSLFRDASFMREFIKLASIGALGLDIQALVYSCNSRSVARLPTIVDEKDGTIKPDKSRLTRRWYTRFSQPAARSHRIGAEWRATTFRLRAEFANSALAIGGEAHAMSLNLGEAIEKTALEKGAGAKRYITLRLSYFLERVLGRKVEFWFFLEESDSSRRHLHLHGAIGCTSSERKKVRQALRKAGGEWEPAGAKFQTFLQLNPDNGVVSYALKNPWLVNDRILDRSGKPWWGDDPFMITQDLKREAKAMYRSVRDKVALSAPGIRKIGALP
jgi:hypothetical protein